MQTIGPPKDNGTLDTILVQVNVRQARVAAEAIRNERVAALGPDPACPVPIP